MNGGRAAQREIFRSAVYSEKDPYAVAHVLLTASTVASPQQGQPPQVVSSSESSLQDHFGNEWGPVFRSWLDTWEYANAVGFFIVQNIFVYIDKVFLCVCLCVCSLYLDR